jgi:hypothetical protein
MYRPYGEFGTPIMFAMFTYCRGFVPWREPGEGDETSQQMALVPVLNGDKKPVLVPLDSIGQKRPHVTPLTSTPDSRESETAQAVSAA